MCKVSDKSKMVGGIIGWLDMELPSSKTDPFLEMLSTYHMITLCVPIRLSGAFGGHQASSSRAAQVSEARLYILLLIAENSVQ